MKHRPLSLVTLTLAAVAWSTPSASHGPIPIGTPAAATASAGKTVLSANVHPLARAEFDLGPVDGSMQIPKISFVIKPSPAQQRDRDALLAAVQDPGSSVFHRWLTPEAYAARFGASAQTVAQMTAWLEAQGFKVDGPSRTGTQLFFSGTAAQVAAAFDTELHHYNVNGAPHMALSRAPSVPSEFASSVHGLHGLHDFRKHAPKLTKSSRPRPMFDAGYDNADTLAFAPSDYATIYDITPLYTAGIDGTGQSIAIIGQSDVVDSDITGFRTLFSLPTTAPAVKKVLVPNSGTATVQQGDVDESELDLEWSGAVAKNAQIVFVFTGDSPLSNGVDDALAYAVDAQLAPVMSESYGGCDIEEPANANLDGEVIAAGNLLGITILASAGDSGAEGCFPQVYGPANGPPSDIPGVVSVGGTEFPPSAQVAPYWNTADNALEYPAPGGVTLETVWNDSQTPATSQNSGGPAAGGGGPSAIWTKPFWQQNVTPADGWRDTPDISLSASNMNVPYTIYDTNSGGSSTDGGVDPLVALGGTSCSSPSLAGIFALLNQSLAKKNGSAPGLGNANPVLYALAKSVPGAFHDIATGTNAIPCTPGTDPQCPDSGAYAGYAAVAGYDEATGWGTIDANQFVNAWTALNPTTTNLAVGATSVALGAKVQLNATIASNVATPALTGTVSFSFVTYTEDGGTDDSWDLGDTPITATTTGGKAGGTATLTTAIPPGLSGNAQVVAMYNGDSHYLWSQSARTHVTVTGLTLAISPASATVAPNASLTVTATGGVAPLTWSIVRDSTFDQNTFTGASITPAASGPTAVYTAGDTDGATVIQVLDADGQDAFLTITVAGAPIDAGADDGGASADAGAVHDGGSPDGGTEATTDGGAVADGGESSASGSSGCSCLVAGSGTNGTAPPGGAAALGGLLFGLVALSRRRRSRR